VVEHLRIKSEALGGAGVGGEMAQIMYAYMNKQIKTKKGVKP
jgi:hypothetical protein